MQLTVRDAARYLGVSEETLTRWVKRGELPAHSVNDQYRFNRVDLLEWAAQRKIPVSAEILEEPGARTAPPRLADAVRAGGVHRDIPGTDPESVLRAVVERIPLPPGTDRPFLLEMLLAREKLGSTALGNGIAIPHPRDPIVLRVERPSLSICSLAQPARFAALDSKPVHTLCVLIAPTVRSHLSTLARLAAVLRDAAVPPLLEARAGRDQVLAAVERVEAELAERRARSLERSDGA